MLSPSISTKVNGNLVRAPVRMRASAYCSESPVPMSPKTANFTEPLFSGSAVCCAAAPATSSVQSEAAIHVRRSGVTLELPASRVLLIGLG